MILLRRPRLKHLCRSHLRSFSGSSQQAGVFALAQAKQDTRTDWSTGWSHISWAFVVCAAVASYGYAFFVGLWKPLLRDAQTAKDAAALVDSGRGRIPDKAAELLAHGAVVVIDGFLPSESLSLLQKDLDNSRGAMGLNPKVQAGNLDIRTDRVAYIREAGADWSIYGSNLISCHRLLRGVAWELEGRASKGVLSAGTSLLVPGWTQLAVYNGNGSFYTWHSDGLDFPMWYWLTGPLALYAFLHWGAVRRRAVTAILYLNDVAWLPEWGGALHARAPMVHFKEDGSSAERAVGTEGYVKVLPQGGRLILFDAQVVEHEVAPSMKERWAISMWFSC